MSAVALTDHGRASNLLKFKKVCEKKDVKWIPGIELYVAPTDHTLKEKIDGHIKTAYHLPVLAKNYEGLKNIFHVVNDRQELKDLLRKFSFGELYPPKEHQLLQRWFKKRETIKNWFQTSVDYLIIRQQYSKELGGKTNWDGAKVVKRLFRIKHPPRRR